MQDSTGITSYAYDQGGRQTEVVNPTGKALTYSFDGAGNRVAMLDPDGGRTTYQWDGQNRVALILNPWAERTTIAWDGLDRESLKTLGNGMQHRHTFDASGRETLLENLKADGSALAVYTATYDRVNNRLSVQELDGVRGTYAYDTAYQLTNEQRSGANAYNTTYVYDQVGNRLQKVDSGAVTTYLYNVADELLTVTLPAGQVTTSTWDANGNLRSEEAAAGLTSYSWDEENRLTQIAYPGGTADTMTYGADGLRRKRETSSTTRNFLWDGVNLLQELDAALSTVAQYTDFPGTWGGLVSMRRSGSSSFYGFDLQANARLLASAAGAVTDSYLQKAFGEELVASGATDNPFRFGGQVGYHRQMAEPVYVRARHLSVAQGRWLGRDPLGLAAWGIDRGPDEHVRLIPSVELLVIELMGNELRQRNGGPQGASPVRSGATPASWWHAYAYAANAPITYRDPSGLLLIWDCIQCMRYWNKVWYIVEACKKAYPCDTGARYRCVSSTPEYKAMVTYCGKCSIASYPAPPKAVWP